MKSFKNVQDIIGDLPHFPKVYLLGSTGAGKTTIVRTILGTSAIKFPPVTQSRTTVAVWSQHWIRDDNIIQSDITRIGNRDSIG